MVQTDHLNVSRSILIDQQVGVAWSGWPVSCTLTWYIENLPARIVRADSIDVFAIATHQRMEGMKLCSQVPRVGPLREETAAFWPNEDNLTMVVSVVGLLAIDSAMKLAHAIGQLPNQLVQCCLLLVNPHLVLVLLVQLLATLIDCLASHIANDVIASLNVLVNCTCEIVAAQWTLCLDLEPLLAAIHVEVVLGVAREDDYLIFGGERDQTDRAVRHVCVLL